MTRHLRVWAYETTRNTNYIKEEAMRYLAYTLSGLLALMGFEAAVLRWASRKLAADEDERDA